MIRKLYVILFAMIMAFSLVGCEFDDTVTISQDDAETEQSEPIIYEAMMYDNNGNNFLNFEGSNFTIMPNKVKQYGYDTDGSWISYYETSSVMTIEVDGNFIQSCGSTIIFKDKRLKMLEIPSELSTKKAIKTDEYTVTSTNRNGDTYLGLKFWWYDMKEKGQNGEKIVLIQSQDGYNIGAFVGSDVTWDVTGKLPKTTKIMIDGLPLYIHRCNFTIIDNNLIENSLT